MKLMVGSVFSNSPRTKTWYELQMKFLKETTNNFEHFVIITQNTDHKIFKSKILKVLPVGCYNKLKVHGREGEFTAHLEGCNELLTYYRNHPEFDHLLLLDSDCFPIRKGWRELLVQRMGDKHYAAPLRMENFDYFPHPCAFFLKDKHWKWTFTPDKWIKNLIGQRFIDVGTSLDMQWHYYPLIRSNMYNPHPILAGIYYDMFYHHCCGSREIRVRTLSNGYWDHKVSNHQKIEKYLFESLLKDPKGFINHLRSGNII